MKRLICCFDGTWNDDKNEATLTNVVKLHRAIVPEGPDGTRQMSRYIVGIGTGYQGRERFWRGATGVDVGHRVISGYRFLLNEYEPGDELYFFGFSRGAFEARSLAALVSLIGIGREADGFRAEAVWPVYERHRTAPDHADILALRSKAHIVERIACVGVWDTVGNLGNPFLPDGPLTRRKRFHDMRLPDTIGVGLHALSIDEVRGPFSPTLWTRPREASPPPSQTVEQVWFPGSHADVGGGFRETALSDVALEWMADRVLSLTPLALDIDGLIRISKADPLGPQHSATAEGIYRWSGRLPYVRLIGQDMRALAWPRRLVFADWRTTRLPASEVMINESVHDSALARFGKEVPLLAEGEAAQTQYVPRNLQAALEDKI